jgi:hypothetical protein
MSRTYPVATDGQWIRPARRGFKLQCCDCCLVHRVEFKLWRGHIVFRAFRAPRSTALMRRHRRIRVVKR